MLRLFRRKPRPVEPVQSDQLPLQLGACDDSSRAVATPAGAGPTPANPPPPSRRIAILRNQPVPWELVRSRRRTIGFQVDQRGLRVSAPRWVPIREIEQALQKMADWILRKLAEWQQHERRRQDLMPRWEHGAPVRLLGETHTLELDPTITGVLRDGKRLRVGLPADAPGDQIRDHAQKWLRDQARELFAERIPIYSGRLGRAPSRWSLSSARTRWGSCNPDGSIRLSWRLVHFPIEVVDYVIAHELAHLVELNHSPRFWSLVGQLFPDWERVRGSLRHHYDDLPEG